VSPTSDDGRPGPHTMRLDEGVRSRDPAARRAALGELLERARSESFDRVRRPLLRALVLGGWAEKRLVLRLIAERFPQLRADEVLELVGDRSDTELDRPPRSPDEGEVQASLLAEVGLLVVQLRDVKGAEVLARRAAGLCPPGRPLARSRIAHVQGLVHLEGRRWEESGDALELALRLSRRLDDRFHEAWVLDSLGSLRLEQLHLGEADDYFRQSLYLKVDLGDVEGQAVTHMNLGAIAQLRGEHELALEHFQRARGLSEELGDAHGLSVTATLLAEVYLGLGDATRAVEILRAGQEAAAGSHRRTDAAACERLLGRVALEQGDLDAAERHLDASRALYVDARERGDVLRVDLLRGVLARRRGQLEPAARGLADVAEGFAELHRPAGQAEALLELSLVRERQGRDDERLDLLEEGLRVAQRLGHSPVRKRIESTYALLRASDSLARAGLFPREELEELIGASRRTGRGMGRVLVQRGAVTAAQLHAFLERELGIRRANLRHLERPSAAEALAMVPRRTAETLEVLPLGVRGGRLRLAMSDPLDFVARFHLELATGLEVQPFHLPSEELAPAVQTAYAGARLELAATEDGEAAVDRLLEHAAGLGATDIHLESKREGVAIRLRVDGVLQFVERLSWHLGRRVLSRVKLMAGLDIAERRMPQDGRCRHEGEGFALSMRVSSLPSLHGENVVARLLDEQRRFALAELGLGATPQEALRDFIGRQEGMALVVGPTGSGKTTTLYGLLGEIDASARAVFTAEDPIEIEVAQFTQSQIQPEIGLDFATVLKALLRQDPEVVLIGEMRDQESAEIAVRMALTGHLVVSTLHTYDATQAITRLTEIGVSPYTVAAVLNLVLAQRLVRRLCEDCKVPEHPDRRWLRRLDPDGHMVEVLEDAKVFGPKGCAACHQLGFRGRLPVFELLEVDAKIEELIQGRTSAAALREEALRRGLAPIQASGLRRVLAGETSVRELLRVL